MQSSGFIVVEEFLIGSVISRSFSTIWRRPGIFLGLPLVLMVLLGLIVGLLISTADWSLDSPNMAGNVMLVLAAIYVFGILVQGAIAYAVYQTLCENEVTLWQSLGKALPRVPVLVFVCILTGFCITVGFMLLIIPGLFLLTAWSVAVQACVVERASLLTSIKRSETLTKGNRLKILGLIILVTVFGWIIGDSGLTVLLGAFINSPVVSIICYTLVKLLVMAFSSVMYAIVYFDLRTIDEGVSLEHLSHVFD